MIGRLTGQVAVKRAPQILIDCNGVGYEVDVSMSTFYQLPAVGDQVSVWTHLLIKDDQHALIGFYTEQERSMFRQLIKINGVGPKMALTILSGISESDFVLCIQSSDIATLTRLPGVGKRTAERLIMELRDKIGTGSHSDDIGSASQVNNLTTQKSSTSEAVEALLSLGYKTADASKMINMAVKQSDESSAEALIKLALKNSVTR